MDCIWVTLDAEPVRVTALGRRYKRMRVKGHYRDVIRDSEGKFKKVKKWSSKKRR